MMIKSVLKKDFAKQSEASDDLMMKMRIIYTVYSLYT